MKETINLTNEGRTLLNRILDYNNENVLARYMADYNASHQDANRVFIAFKQYMAACVFMDGRKTSSAVIDDMWHTFLLFTRQYRDFCTEYLGGYIDHEPIADGESPRYYVKTRELAQALCAELDNYCWPTKATEGARCISGGDCSGYFAQHLQLKTA